MTTKTYKRIRHLTAVIAVLGAAMALSQPLQDSLAAARQMIDAGKFPEAQTALHDLLVTNPSDPDAHFLLGYVLFRQQNARESLAEFTAGAKFRRPTADEFKIIASDYILLDDFVDADKWFSEAVAESPSDADANYLLGRTRFNENDYPAAISSFERTLALRPKYVEAENNIGLAWKELNDAEKAKAAFQTAIDWQDNTPVDAQPFLNLGTLLADQSHPDLALPYLEKAAALSPDNPTIHEELSHVYASQQNLPKAQSELERAVALAPNTSSLHYQLGQIFRKEGLKDRAQQEFAICDKLSKAHSSDKIPNPISVKQFNNTSANH